MDQVASATNKVVGSTPTNTGQDAKPVANGVASDQSGAVNKAAEDLSVGQLLQEKEAVKDKEHKIEEPANPVGSAAKEFAPIPSPSIEAPKIEAPIEEVLTPTETTPDLPQEVKEAGVEVSPSTEHPQVPNNVKQDTGMEPAKDAVPVQTAPTGAVQIPDTMDEKKATATIKAHPPTDSARWSAELFLHELKRKLGKIKA